jgi:hypothetical protein
MICMSEGGPEGAPNALELISHFVASAELFHAKLGAMQCNAMQCKARTGEVPAEHVQTLGRYYSHRNRANPTTTNASVSSICGAVGRSMASTRGALWYPTGSGRWALGA